MTGSISGASRAVGLADGARRALAPVDDLSVRGRDGRDVAVRVTRALGEERQLLVFHNGTASGPDMLDGMARELAQRGITTWSVGTRTHLDDAGRVLPDAGWDIHSDDLARVVDLAVARHPRTPAALAGSSLGAVTAMHYNATRNGHGLPVLAMNPVLLERFLPFGDKLKVAGSLVSGSAARLLVPTPMAAGRQMTTNPASQYVTRAGELSELHVPARVFRDVARMNIDALLRGRGGATGGLKVLYAGDDAVGVNRSARPLERAAPRHLRLPAETVPGAPHDMSQEWHDSRVVDALARFVGAHARQAR